jgi:hypothetical protein
MGAICPRFLFNFVIVGVRAEARCPLWNEIRFCERAIATSRAFSSVIIADHSDWYEENEMSRYV